MRSEVLYRALKRVSSKRLIKGRLVSPEGEFCSLGACLTPAQRAKFSSLECADDWEEHCYQMLTKKLGKNMLNDIYGVNDGFGMNLNGETPEARYKRMLAWASEDVK